MRDAFALKFWSEPSEKSTRFLARLRVFKAVVETVTVRYTDAGKVYTQAGVVADDLGPGGFYFGEDDGGGGGDGRRDDGGDGDSCKDGAGAMGLDAGELSVAVISDDDVSDDDVDFDSDDGEDELRRPRALPPERPRALPPEPSGSSAADAKKAEVVAQMDAALASTARVEPGDRPEFGLPIKAEWLEKILRGEKTVELRGKGTAKVGQRIGLICSKSSTPASMVMGECLLAEARGPLTNVELLALQPQHCVHARDDGEPDTADELRESVEYKKVHAWVFEDVIVYETFIPYEHPRGAVGWIDLTKAIVERPQMSEVQTIIRHDVDVRPRAAQTTSNSRS
ncbi:hypothetical protein AURANDRAFT_62698 [Aureococcus anophagefferens]|uniref:ASCH domain-containing protein n=1 Tax=Aureococcus anophagefferens TaxID=44056 RepID=F0Y4I9_AURAN|nr:hypothetical protein AURANDRAFT_62698 [Aureococcus anophagefferens]EGB10385.1 hypothetical protein AURANDRAFT_62698 [Aureococcus anophagefferens]|eukprot:XP_009035188.1 hypothetical protein AURANDRAFT_62698 [Aureococcus anophagefferens]